MDLKKQIIKWSKLIFKNQAKIGEILALNDEEEVVEGVREALKNGIKIHKRHREIIKELADFLHIGSYDDEINVNNRIIDKVKAKNRLTLVEQINFIIEVTYESMKSCDLIINEMDNVPEDFQIKLKHLRPGYLNFIDEMQVLLK